MHSGSAPIGFEGLLTESKKSLIGFEQYEGEQRKVLNPGYPLDDVMPSPNQTLRNTSDHSHSSSSLARAMPSASYASGNNTFSSTSSRKSLSHPQLFATYNEIMNIWFQTKWLAFDDSHTETFLTLDSRLNENLTIQTAIDRYHLTTGETLLCSLPDCLLIRTKSKTQNLFIPNLTISLENLCENDTVDRFSQYKLMAMICHSNKTGSKLMFYKSSQLNSWFIYYDQSILSHAHSNRLSDEEQYQLESFLEQKHRIDPLKFTSPLSSLCHHPIIYVYIPKKN